MLDSATNRAGTDGFPEPRPALEVSRGLHRVLGAVGQALRSLLDLRMSRFRAGSTEPLPQAQRFRLPGYLEDNYWWAYLRPASLKVFDHTPIVSAILWGWYGRLKQAAFAELKPGQRVLQAACVYGDLSPQLARSLGAEGRLDIVDIAPLQVANCRRKLREFSHAQVRVADAAAPAGGPYDAVCCFFLLHELPDQHKRRVVDALLNSVGSGGKVIFVDYHRPDRLHPLKGPMGIVFDYLEPFAKTLWCSEISTFAASAEKFTWRKETYFGGLYQKVVVERREPSEEILRAA